MSFASRARETSLVYVNIAAGFRIGPGPSSSQTVAPIEAARRFVHELAADGLVGRTSRVRVELYGGLACTGRELGTQRSVVAGLAGIPTASCDAALLARGANDAEQDGVIALGGRHRIEFQPARDIAFRIDRALAYDGNAMRFTATDAAGETLSSRVFYSIGDGLVVARDETPERRGPARVPFPFSTADELLDACRAHGKRIADLALANEAVVHSPGEIRALLLRVADAMRGSIQRGLATDGTLPGGAVRQAPTRADALRETRASAAQWCAVFATAVAEENAAGGRVVAAPTNGSAGPVAALLSYFSESGSLHREQGTIDFLLTAAAVGGVLRAQGLTHAGCQSAVGVAAAMAAAGYAATQGATNEQVLMAAELALEPHLGLACDPEGALIQRPCIERNAAAASRAIAAVREALRFPAPRNALDALVRSMIERGRQMSTRHKRASLAGIAVNVADC
jgi:L-serine dehydratase